jgi:hypothetical protein
VAAGQQRAALGGEKLLEGAYRGQEAENDGARQLVPAGVDAGAGAGAALPTCILIDT